MVLLDVEVTVSGPIRAPSCADRFHALTPLMVMPGCSGALECSAIDKSVNEGVAEVDEVDSMMRTQK